MSCNKHGWGPVAEDGTSQCVACGDERPFCKHEWESVELTSDGVTQVCKLCDAARLFSPKSSGSRKSGHYDVMDGLVEEMNEIRNGARKVSYGDAALNHQNIATGWSVLLGVEVTPAQVAICMAWLKLARTVPSPELRDSYVDAANYMVIAGALALEEEK